MSENDLDDATALARRALPVFGIAPDARLTFVKQRENVVYRVDDGDRAYALRLHRSGLRSLSETACEIDQAIAFHRAGIPVSEFVAPVDGAEPGVRNEDGTLQIVDVQHWVVDADQFGDSGDSWSGEGETPTELFDRVGEVLGRMHAVSQRLGRIPGYDRPAWDAEGLAGDGALWGDPRRLASNDADRTVIGDALTRIRTTLDDLGTGPDVYGVIHADTTPENILVRDGDVTLIDFDDFGEGWWLFDLATLLWWYHRHPRYAEYRAALLAGYEREFPIPVKARAALDTLVLARGLTYLGWAADRPGDETSEFLEAEVLPVLVEACRAFVAGERFVNGDAPNGDATNGDAPGADATNGDAPGAGAHGGDRAPGDGGGPDALGAREADLVRRRSATIGPYSPLFYDRPLHFVRGEGAWLFSADGERYLDAYNNVPQVGHANPRVADAVVDAMRTLTVHTRYLSEPIVDYAEALLATFEAPLDRVYFTNSGSESNELALRIARHATGASGVIVTDFSYHGNTISLAQLTTGLTVSEPFGDHVRTIHVPDVDAIGREGTRAGAVIGAGAGASRGATRTGRAPSKRQTDALRKAALAEVDAAIASLVESGHGVSALLIDPSFSTEGLPRLPEGYLAGLAKRVRAAGGLVIADEVQAGLGRLGDRWWGHQVTGLEPDLVTLGKPLGNGYPLGGVVTTEALLESFSSVNMYFNTFAGTPASAAAGHAVLREMHDRDLVARTGTLGRHVAERLAELAARHDRVAAARGQGLFFGLELVDEHGAPDGALAKRIVEALVRERILISRIGPNDNVLKIRPPLVIEQAELDQVIDALDTAITEATADARG